MLKKTLLFFIAILHPLGIHAQDFLNVTYHTCYDGVTWKVSIPDVPEVSVDHISIRLKGIDTPEIKGKCEQKKNLAKQARDLPKLMSKMRSGGYTFGWWRDWKSMGWIYPTCPSKKAWPFGMMGARKRKIGAGNGRTSPSHPLNRRQNWKGDGQPTVGLGFLKPAKSLN